MLRNFQALDLFCVLCNLLLWKKSVHAQKKRFTFSLSCVWNCISLSIFLLPYFIINNEHLISSCFIELKIDFSKIKIYFFAIHKTKSINGYKYSQKHFQRLSGRVVSICPGQSVGSALTQVLNNNRNRHRLRRRRRAH